MKMSNTYYNDILEEFCNSIESNPRTYYEFNLSNSTATLTQMKNQGTNSRVYDLVITNSDSGANISDAVLKYFVPVNTQHTTDTILEVNMQKYAHSFQLAPEVYASNAQAMISEKCSYLQTYNPDKEEFFGINCVNAESKENIRDKYFALANKSNLLQTTFNDTSLQTLELAKTMYEQIGMFNTDPNPANYMNNSDNQIVQIDYGSNRFQEISKLNDFITFCSSICTSENVETFSEKHYKEKLLATLKIEYPPSFYWFYDKIYIVNDIVNYKHKYESMTEVQYSDLFTRLKQERDRICNELKEHSKLSANGNPTFKTYFKRKKTNIFVTKILEKTPEYSGVFFGGAKKKI
jgi:hypothetical protein